MTSEVEHIQAMADIQEKIIEMRRLADRTPNPRQRDICLQIAEAIEAHARELDANID